MADTRITDAEIAGYMGWRGPGAYTEASLRKIRQIVDHVLRAERATPPSPSTAPEVDERAAFEVAFKLDQFQRRPHAVIAGDYQESSTQCAWNGWQARAALSSRPAEVDDEGLAPAPATIPRASNDALIVLAKYWKLDGDWMTCKGCRRSLIASRDGEELNHGDGCKFWDQQHPWANLRELITRRPALAEGMQ